MSTITAIISLFTRTPSRQRPSTFSEDMDVRLSEENSRITQMNNMSSQMNTVAGEVNTNAQIASDSAATATEKAQIATDKAAEALASANNADTSEENALSYAQSALYSKNAAEASATLAEGYAESINPDNLVYKTTDQTIEGIKTFSSSPIVPTPNSDMQASTKKYVDDGLDAKANTIVANDSQVKTALNASGTAPIYACRAWVNFNGTGTVAIRASGNVSSITDNGTGSYTVNFITSIQDEKYSFSCLAEATGQAYCNIDSILSLTSSTSFRFNVRAGGTSFDSAQLTAVVFR